MNLDKIPVNDTAEAKGSRSSTAPHTATKTEVADGLEIVVLV